MTDYLKCSYNDLKRMQNKFPTILDFSVYLNFVFKLQGLEIKSKDGISAFLEVERGGGGREVLHKVLRH